MRHLTNTASVSTRTSFSLRPVRFRSLATVGSGRPSATEAGWGRRERRVPGLMRGCHAARDAARAGLEHDPGVG